MASLSFATLRKANIARLPLFKNSRGEPAHSMPDGSDWSLNDWMTAILGELGEAANIVKKIRRGDMSLIAARDALGDEFADVVIYTDLTAFRIDVGLNNFKFMNFEDLRGMTSQAPFKMRNMQTLSDCMTAALAAYGHAANCLSVETFIDATTFRAGVLAIGRAAFLAGIDLGAKVREKFNVVSRRVGADVFINEDDCVVDHNGSLI